MEADVVKAFHNELVSLYELKPPISKNKIQEITKAAIRAIKYYKHVVFGVEKFLTKCKPEYKLPGMYCIDSIIRQSQHQYKEKDVFAARFAHNMLQTVLNLMSCKAEDTMKIVRVMNLWIVQKVYDEKTVRPWLDYCRETHGVDTDFLHVERSVKGDAANLALYSKVLSKADLAKASSQIQSPPLNESSERKGLLPRTPPLETGEEAMDGSISEKETLEIITNMKLDLGGMFTQDSTLLKRLNKIVNEKLIERREIDSRRQGNIKNLLSREFDYSDEEDSGDEDVKRLSVEAKPAELTKQQIRGMAETVLRDEGVKEEIQRMHTERLTAMSQTTIPHFQSQAIQNALSLPSNNTPISIPLNSVEGGESNVLSMNSMQPSFSIRPPALMPMGVQGSQMLIGGTNGVPGFPQNILPPGFNIPPPQHQQQPLQSQHNISMQNNAEASRIDVDQDDRIRRNSNRYDLDRDNREHHDNRNRDRREDKRRSRFERDERGRDRTDFHEYDQRPSKKSRRSRSRERDDPRKDRRRTPSNDRCSRSHGHERDFENSMHREIERQRRKIGIPWPPKEGHLLSSSKCYTVVLINRFFFFFEYSINVIVASCTLWFGRLPSNCSEEDIRLSVIEAGEPKRINIIPSRACAYVTMKDRKAAFRVMDRLQRNMQVAKRNVKARQGLKDKFMDYWDSEHGVSQIPHSKLPENLEPLLDGGQLDVETLPSHLAGFYDEYGLKHKKSDNLNGSSQDLQAASTLASLAYSAGQPNAVMSNTFFSMPTFPPALPPGVSAMTLPGYGKAGVADAKLNNMRVESDPNGLREQVIPNSRFSSRPPVRGSSFGSGMPPFPRVFPVAGNIRLPRGSGFRGGGGPGFRGNRPNFLPRNADVNFRGRPRFMGGQYSEMDSPPRFFNPGPPGVRGIRPMFRPKEEDTKNVEATVSVEQKENQRQHHEPVQSITNDRREKGSIFSL
uniref:CID domain-containing protein n=1 Tax=Syphacia muris TaxID=451379 RepID=A0A0N5A8P1_9BILA